MARFNLKENIPQKKCEDKNCPYHGTVKVRGRYFEGKVVSDKMYKTITIERHFLKYIPKYNRYTRKKTKIQAHNPECIDAKTGMMVLIGETRPLSKTKNFVVLKIMSADELDSSIAKNTKDTVTEHNQSESKGKKVEKKAKSTNKSSEVKSKTIKVTTEEQADEGVDELSDTKSTKQSKE